MTHLIKTTALQALADKVEAGKVAQWFNWSSGIKGHGTNARLAYGGDLSAANALHDAVFPRNSHQWHVSDEANFDGFVCQIFSCAADRYVATAHQPTPARAWLLAILRALIAGVRDD